MYYQKYFFIPSGAEAASAEIVSVNLTFSFSEKASSQLKKLSAFARSLSPASLRRLSINM